MKTKIFYLMLLSCITANAQEAKNTFKTNLGGYFFRNVNLSYERSINKTFAVNVSFGTVPKGDVPMMKKFIGEDADQEIRDIQFGSTTFTIEPRIYFGKKYNAGFYLAPYYRYTNMKVDSFVYDFSYTTDANVERDIPLDMSGKITANSFGLMIGAQWLIGKEQNWIIDWWIAGGHYGFSKGDIEGKTRNNNDLTDEDQRRINEDLNDLDVPIIDYKAEVNSKGARVKIDGPWAGLRSGIAFGYRF